jgi:FkbM family methyltransferase
MNSIIHKGLLKACRKSYRAYRHANFVVDAGSLRIPIVNGTGMDNLSYRSAQFARVLHAALGLNLSGHVVDIGANIGQLLLNLAEIDRSRAYIGIEPLPSAANYVQRLITENSLKAHSVIAIALGDQCGTARIRFNDEHDVSATLSDSNRPSGMYRYERLIGTLTGDIVFKDLPSIAFVKLDVEGTEINVLRGMTSTLAAHRCPILMEVMPYSYFVDGTFDRNYFGNISEAEARRVAESRRQHCSDLEVFFRDIDYQFFSCSPDGNTSQVCTLDRGSANWKDRGTDFLMVPAELSDQFQLSLSQSWH